jgi:WD40 repeat protein
MISRSLVPVVALGLLLAAGVRAADAPDRAADAQKPLLRLEAGGPTAYVTALAFSPDGQTLYAAGWDKVVRTWVLRNGRFVLDPRAYRVPLTAGMEGGNLNALALSDDGKWLAVGGKMLVRGAAGLLKPGLIAGFSEEMELDQGTIYVFSTADPAARVHRLRGLRGSVLALAFAPARPGQIVPALVSAALERQDNTNAYVGTVRLWDVDRATGSGWRLPTLTRRPGVAVWRTGPQANQLQIGLAWDDGRFRVWDVASDQLRDSKDGQTHQNHTIAYLPERQRVLSGSFADGQARLQLWQVTAAGEPRADATVATFAEESGIYYAPRALAAFTTGAQARGEYAALILEPSKRRKEYSLAVIALDPAPHGNRVRVRVPLWPVGGLAYQPALAVSADGRYLAVTGDTEHTISVYAVADLLAGKKEPLQPPLASAGTIVRYVRFATHGNDTGLLFHWATEDTGAGLTEQAIWDAEVFDFTHRRLTAAQAAWQPVSAEPWRVEKSFLGQEENADGKMLRSFALIVRAKGEERGRVELKAIRDVTHYAVLPPGRTARTPLVAIAYLDVYGQPWLGLYDAATGEQLRQFTGHQAPILSVAFSGDGRLLASSAEDETVCVWSLTDLDRVVNRLGTLRGVYVGNGKDAGVVVQRLDGTSLLEPNRGKIAQGDVIESVVEKGQPRAAASALDFYEAISRVRPGESIHLRIRGRQEDTVLRVSQGVDEAKPLFTLFVTHAAKPEDRAWVGWNPLGFYDASDRRAESYLGWHRNTGDGDHPTTFALIDQYRKWYYDKGILQTLVKEARLPRDRKPYEEARAPSMSLWLEDDKGKELPKVGGVWNLLRRPNAAIQVAINDLPPDGTALVRWSLERDDPPGHLVPVQQVALTGDGLQSVDLSALPWKRGRYTLHAQLHTGGSSPKAYPDRTMRLLYLPPPPVLESDQLGKELRPGQPKFTFEAAVRPGQADQPFTVQITSRRDHRPLWKTEITRDEAIKKTFDIQEGDNNLEIVAVNQGALAGQEDLETTRAYLKVSVQGEDQPRISMSRVVPLLPQAAEGAGLAIEPGKPVVVHVPRIRIEGLIKATKDLANATAIIGKESHPLKGFGACQGTSFSVAEEVALQPGRQEISILAKTTAGAQHETAPLAIDYVPPLPRLALRAPRPDQDFYEGTDPRTVDVEGMLTFLAESPPFAAHVWLNDKELPEPPVIDAQTGKLRARVPLQPGENRIQVKLSHKWDTATFPGLPLIVRYWQLPFGVQLATAAKGLKPLPAALLGWPPGATPPGVPQLAEAPLLDRLDAHVSSALPLQSVTAEVVGRNGSKSVPAVLDSDPGQQKLRTIQLRRVPLDRGLNLLRVWASNAQGPSRQPGTMLIWYAPRGQPPATPVVEWMDPAIDGVVGRPLYRVRFHIHSPSKPEQIALVRNGEVLFTLDGARLQKVQDAFEVDETVPVALKPGANALEVAAVNAGGERRARVILSYVPPPVRVEIDRLELPGDPTHPIEARQGADHRQITFARQPPGKVGLVGRVLWPDEDERLDQPAEVVVSVNEKKHSPQPLQPRAPGARDRVFKVDIELTRRAGNTVEVDFPDLQLPPDAVHQFTVSCAQPAVQKRGLHILIVDPDEDDERAVTGRVLHALQAGPVKDERFKALGFDGRLYPPLVGDSASATHVLGLINRIKMALRVADKTEHSLDVVLVYYKGPESYWLKITNDCLSQQFQALPGGGQVILLDVTRDAALRGAGRAGIADRIARVPDDCGIGVFCYGWIDRTRPPQQDALLLSDFQDALARASNLAQVDAHLEQKFVFEPGNRVGISKKYPRALRFDRNVPVTLKPLTLASP